jgi:hypothetical protein
MHKALDAVLDAKEYNVDKTWSVLLHTKDGKVKTVTVKGGGEKEAIAAAKAKYPGCMVLGASY